MMKKWKLWSILLLIFLLTGGFIAWFWFDRITHRDVTEEEVGVEKGFFDFDSVLSEVTPLSTTESPENTNQEPNNKVQTPSQKPAQNTALTSSQTRNPSSSENNSGKNSSSTEVTGTKTSLTEQQIYRRYYPAFARLEQLALYRIDQLVSAAKVEYNNKKGEPGFSKVDFASRYMSAANKLQGEVDKVFYKLLDAMRAELKENQLSLSLAEEAEKTYQDKIQAKKNEILGKAFFNDN